MLKMDVGSGEWWEGRITKGLDETLGGDGYVIHHIVMVVVTVVVTVSQVYNMSKLIILYILNMCSLLYINYTSINVLK